MTKKILECRGLQKRFGPNYALGQVDLTLVTGRIVGLLGPNGSGKTTLIKLAAGLLTPTAGEILVDGRPPSVDTKMTVSYLPDKTYFDEWMKVHECLRMFEEFYSDFDTVKAREILQVLGVDARATFRALSKGTKEKLQLALVMSRNAQLYLLDEPIGGVDPAARDFILDTIIKNYNPNGTVLISTHLIGDIEKVLDDVVFLMSGRIERYQSADMIREATGKSVDEVFREVYRC
jgi:ABC-2 type transport system ATP-binding protein